MIQCMAIQVLEIKKSESYKRHSFSQKTDKTVDVMLVVYLYLINYARSKSDEIAHAIPGFLSVRKQSMPCLRGQ